ncbi:MAG TPA: hypothetical protein VF881_02550 [Polyangiaceae bacterium]
MNSNEHGGHDERRFVEGGAGDSLDEKIGVCLRHVIGLAGLPDAHVKAIGRRLAFPARRASRPRLYYAVLAIIVALCAGSAAAVVRLGRWPLVRWRAPPAESGVAVPAHELERGPSIPTMPLEPAPEQPIAQEVPSSIRAADETLPPATRSLPKRPSIGSPSSTLSSSTPPSPGETSSSTAESASTLGAEARLLRRAIESLRSEANPRLTLALLDEHRQSFPDGRLRANADLLRIDALLALGRRAEALALLQRLSLDDGPRTEELLVTRGELRASSDCASAVRDFSNALARPLSNKWAERALRGRVVCRIREGDRTGAEPDLRAYIARFPNADFAPRVRALLAASER